MSRFTSRGGLIALAVIVGAVIVAFLAASWVDRRPSSSDAAIDADVVHVAPSQSPVHRDPRPRELTSPPR